MRGHEVSPPPAEAEVATPGALIARRASAQFGVISRTQLLAAGLSNKMIRTRINNGLLHPVFEGVYAVGHTALTPQGRATAAVLTCSPGAAAARRTAAAFRELTREWPTVPEIAVRPGLRGKRAGICVLHPVALDKSDIEWIDHVPVTTVERTLVDVAAVADAVELYRLVGEAEYQEALRLNVLRALLTDAQGKRGIALLREIVEDDGPLPTRSVLEDATWRLMRDAGLPRPRSNVKVHGWSVDFWWPERRAVLEVHGWKGHRGRQAFERDHRKQAELELAGFQVVVITWKLLKQRPLLAAALCARALA